MASTSTLLPTSDLLEATPQESESLKAAVFQRLHPRVYLERFIAEGVRPDGREFGVWRDVSVNVGSISTADGSALVRLGDTTIVCGVKAEIAEPELDREGEGFLGEYHAFIFLSYLLSPRLLVLESSGRPVILRKGLSPRKKKYYLSFSMVPGLSTSSLHFTPLAHLNDSNPTLSFRFTVPNLDLPAICSPKFKPGPPTEEAQVLSDRLNEVLIASNILPLSSLSIQHGKAAWVLYVDATCINYDGNAFDAALIAMVAALRNTKLPRATYNPDSGRTICSRKELDPLQLNLQNSPVGISFGIFASTHILADPTSFEEPLLDTTLSIILGPQEQIISVSQIGIGSAGGQDALMKCLEEAKKRRRALKEVIGEV